MVKILPDFVKPYRETNLYEYVWYVIAVDHVIYKYNFKEIEFIYEAVMANMYL